MELKKHTYAARGVNSNLREDFGMQQRKLHRLPKLLLLYVESSNVLVCYSWLLCHNLDIVIGLRRENVNDGA